MLETTDIVLYCNVLHCYFTKVDFSLHADNLTALCRPDPVIVTQYMSWYLFDVVLLFEQDAMCACSSGGADGDDPARDGGLLPHRPSQPLSSRLLK